MTIRLKSILAFSTLGWIVNISSAIEQRQRNFEIDYANDQFLKDGQPFRYVSGSMHYFRILPDEWSDRLSKLRYVGCNAVQTYVEWASHEPEPGVYDFTGINDLETFIQIAQKQDLLVILRVGPFACAERDMGGLPYWLLRQDPNIRLRTADPAFLDPVDNWMGTILLPKLKPLLYENGGPIIMVQVENEYGASAPCDYEYTAHLRQLFRRVLGESVVLFTVDSTGTFNLKCGKIPDVYATVDFGVDADPHKLFSVQRLFQPRGPLVNTEFYSGWLDHWGEPHHVTDSKVFAAALDNILSLNASVNMYMFHGGTNFGLSTGSNLGATFQACPTSYDYDAPLSEAGDPTEKYHLIREVIQKYIPVPVGPVPPESAKGNYGNVSMLPLGTVSHVAALLQSHMHPYPKTFEALSVSSGIVVYETTFDFRIHDPSKLVLNNIHDRGYVYLDNEFAGIVAREQELYEMAISGLPPNDHHTLSIIVESQGRISVGPHLNDFKGITTNVTLNGFTLTNWKMTPLPLSNMTHLNAVLERLEQVLPLHRHSLSVLGKPLGDMTFYKGQFQVPDRDGHPRDTYLRLRGWGKGVAWINNFCLGRYWPEVGPQLTLYAPRGILKRGHNSILLLELQGSPCNELDECYVTLQREAEIDGPTPA